MLSLPGLWVWSLVEELRSHKPRGAAPNPQRQVFLQKLTKVIGLLRRLSGKESTCNAGDTGWSLGKEDPLEEEMATHSSILAWRIPWTEKPGRLQSTGSQKSWIQPSDWACTHAQTQLGTTTHKNPKNNPQFMCHPGYQLNVRGSFYWQFTNIKKSDVLRKGPDFIKNGKIFRWKDRDSIVPFLLTFLLWVLYHLRDT